MLIKVNTGKEENYVSIELEDVAKVGIAREGEGYRYVRGAHSYIELKDGTKYLLNPTEAQRIVDAMQQAE